MNDVQPQAIVIGASAGALDALSVILSSLPQRFPVPIFVVVHLPTHSKSVLAELLAARCHIQVREAEDKVPIEAGTVYVAPPNYHLLIEADKYLSLSNEEPVLYSRPSIDVLFESAAEVYGLALIGVLLTGANSDGSRGLRAIIDAGGRGFVENPETAYCGVMPRSAMTLCPEVQVLHLDEISLMISTL